MPSPCAARQRGVNAPLCLRRGRELRPVGHQARALGVEIAAPIGALDLEPMACANAISTTWFWIVGAALRPSRGRSSGSRAPPQACRWSCPPKAAGQPRRAPLCILPSSSPMAALDRPARWLARTDEDEVVAGLARQVAEDVQRLVRQRDPEFLARLHAALPGSSRPWRQSRSRSTARWSPGRSWPRSGSRTQVRERQCLHASPAPA